MLGRGSVEPEFGGAGAHCFNAEADVRVEVDAELGGTLNDLVAVDGAGEGFVLHLLADAFCFDFVDGAGRLDVADGGEEAGEFVTGEQDLFERRLAGDARVSGVGEDGFADYVTYAALLKNGFALQGVVGRLRVDLPIEVVEESGDGPLLEIAAELGGIGGDASLDGEHVTAQCIVLDEFTDDRPSLFAIHVEEDTTGGRRRGPSWSGATIVPIPANAKDWILIRLLVTRVTCGT